MIKICNLRRFALVSVAISVVVCTTGGKLPTRKAAFLSIPTLNVATGERVVGFEFYITSGRIAAMPDVPIGWDVRVENSPSWNTVVRASSLVGAAAVDPSFFKNFLIVEKNDSFRNPFEIRGEIVVTRDFVEERRIRVSMKDIAIVPETRK